MFRQLLNQEWKLLRRDPAWYVALAILGLTVAYSAYTGHAWVTARRAEVADLLAKRDQLREELRMQAAKPWKEPPRGVMPYAPRDVAVLPPGPAAALAVGQADLLPFSAPLRLFSVKSDLFASYSTDNPATLASGRFDLAFTLAFLMPLLLLALTYNVLSVERERGTLALTLSNPVSLSALLTAKLLIRGSAILIPAVVLSCAALLWAGGPFGGEDLWRLALFAGAVIVYGLFFVALAALVNSQGYASSTNAVALGGLWLLFAIVLPSLGNLGAQTLYPIPSRMDLTNTAREALIAEEKHGTQVLGSMYQLHPELRPASKAADPIPDSIRETYAVMGAAERQVQPLIQRFHRAVQARESSVAALRFLSPTALLQGAFGEIAGTGTARHRDFERQVSDYLDTWRKLLAPRLFQAALLSAADYDWLPKFVYREEPSAQVISRIALPLGLLALAGLVLFAGSVRALARYPVA